MTTHHRRCLVRAAAALLAPMLTVPTWVVEGVPPLKRHYWPADADDRRHFLAGRHRSGSRH